VIWFTCSKAQNALRLFGSLATQRYCQYQGGLGDYKKKHCKKYFFFSILPEKWKSTVLAEASKFASFSLFKKMVLRGKWVWSIGGLVLTGESRSTRKKSILPTRL